MSIQSETHELTIRSRTVLAYGSGDIFGGGATVVIGLYFFFFLTESVGLSPLMAGAVFAVGRLFDAVTDPLMGYLSDITRSRFGRRRIYFLVAIVPVWISFFLLWLPLPSFNPYLQLLYYSSCYLLYSLVYTMVMVPYSALNAELHRSPSVRMRLAGSRMVFTQLTTMAAILVPYWLIDLQQPQGYSVMGAVFATIFCLPWIFVFWGTYELPYRQPSQSVSFRDHIVRFVRILTNRTVRCHMVMHAASYAAVDILMVLAVYFFTFYLGAPQQYYHLSLLLLMTAMVGMLPIYYALSKHMSMRLLYCLAMTGWAIGLLLGYAALRPDNSPFIWFAASFCIGIGAGGSILMPWAIFPLISDVGEYFSGENKAGMYAGMLTLIRKAVQGAFVMPLIGITLHSINYMPQLFPQSQQTATGLQRVFFLAPVFCIAVGVIAGIRFPLTRHRVQLLRDALTDLRGGVHRDHISSELTNGLSHLA